MPNAAHLNQNNAFGAITLPMAGFCSSGMSGIDGIWTKLKYQSKPIHIIPVKTCKYLNNQLKKYLSKTKPSPKKCKPTSNNKAILEATNLAEYSFDPNDPKDILNKIEKVIYSQDEINFLNNYGLNRVKIFNKSEMIQNIKNVYDKLV